MKKADFTNLVGETVFEGRTFRVEIPALAVEWQGLGDGFVLNAAIIPNDEGHYFALVDPAA